MVPFARDLVHRIAGYRNSEPASPERLEDTRCFVEGCTVERKRLASVGPRLEDVIARWKWEGGNHPVRCVRAGSGAAGRQACSRVCGLVPVAPGGSWEYLVALRITAQGFGAWVVEGAVRNSGRSLSSDVSIAGVDRVANGGSGLGGDE